MPGDQVFLKISRTRTNRTESPRNDNVVCISRLYISTSIYTAYSGLGRSKCCWARRTPEGDSSHILFWIRFATTLWKYAHTGMSIDPLVIYYIWTSPDLTYGLYFRKENHHVPSLSCTMYIRNCFGISSVNMSNGCIYLKSGIYLLITLQHISEKNNCAHTRNVKRGHRESSKGIKIRSRCCNIYLMHRYVYKQKQERREWGSPRNQRPLLLLHASLISSSTNPKTRTSPPHITLHIQPQGPTPSSSSSEK